MSTTTKTASVGDLAVLEGPGGRCKLGLVDAVDGSGRVATCLVGGKLQTPRCWGRSWIAEAGDLRVPPERLADLADHAGHTPFNSPAEARAWLRGHLTPAALRRIEEEIAADRGRSKPRGVIR